MSGMPLETCCAFNEWWNNKFYDKVASCWLFLLNHTTMHGSMNIKNIKLFYYVSVNNNLSLVKKVLEHLSGVILNFIYVLSNYSSCCTQRNAVFCKVLYPNSKLNTRLVFFLLSAEQHSLEVSLVQCRRVFQSLRCIQSLRLFTLPVPSVQTCSLCAVALFVYSLYCYNCSTLPPAIGPSTGQSTALHTSFIHLCAGLTAFQSATCDVSTTAAIATKHRAPPTLRFRRFIIAG
jgi:hypothetical protein